LDQDNDKILSKYEYAFDEDGKLIDQDADKVPDVYDFDDDNDGYLTKNEIKYTYTDNGVTYTNYYPFFGAALDDPGTLFVDESKGIPDCANDFTTASRIRKHLDKNCH
jgi:hypothetical protein